MSKVVFLDPIDHVSGKLSKKSRVTYCFRANSNEAGVANVLLRTPLLSWHASTSSLLSHALPLL